MFDWYKIFNLTEFTALDLVSKNYSLVLSEIGQAEILVTKGNYTSMLYEGVFLPINLNNNNPFIFDDFAIYLDVPSQDVYLGVAVES